MFYDRFIALCEKKGVAPTRAAIEAGISKSLVSKWKANEAKEPSPEVIRKLADYFGTSKFEVLEDLPAQQQEKAPTPEGERPISDDDIKFALWGDADDIDDDDLEDVRRYAAFVAERKKKKP